MTADVTSVGAATQVAGAIRQAAHATGASFDYLLATARLESNLDPAAQAPTSSASGLFQFIEQTWLGTMKTSGASLGLGAYADAVSFNTVTGRYEVADAGMRQAIMALRNDASASAALAGAYTRNNAAQLAGVLGRRPTDGELYIAHFLGPQGAERLIHAAVSQPDTPAAGLFPAAAQANRSIFYDRAGRARGTADVYAVLANRFDVARRSTGGAGLRGSVGVVPDTAGVAQAYAQANRAETARTVERAVPDNRPLFQAMFRSGGQPIAPVVEALWSDAAAPAVPVGVAAPARVSRPPAGASAGDTLSPLDFFRDARGSLGRGGT